MSGIFRVVWACVLVVMNGCLEQDNGYEPNSPRVNTRFDVIPDVNKPDVYQGESATTGNVGGFKSNERLVLDKDIPVIVWWTKWVNYYDNPTEIRCGDNTCYSTRNRTWLHSRQTRGVFLYGTDLDPADLPLPRFPHHEWALLHEESPMNNYMLVHPHFIRLINHTATFRRESDFPLSTQNIPSISYLINRKPVTLSIKNSLREIEGLSAVLYVQSHCDVASDRDRYVKALMQYIKVDSYGSCLNNKQLPENLQDPVESMESSPFLDFIARYKFHIAFENAICEDYMTEKLFRPLHVGSVPIYMGSPKANDWMPNSHSLVLATDFDSPKELADFIHNIDSNDSLYEKYLQYKTEPIQNNFLLQHMKARPWGNEHDSAHYTDFIAGFECYVCNSISAAHYTWVNEETTQTRALKIASRNHLHCPQPYPSVGDVNELRSNDSWNRMSWIDDYWTGFDRARAAAEMVQAHEKDPATFDKYWMDIMKKSGIP